MRRSVIKGVGHYLPERRRSENSEFENSLDTTHRHYPLPLPASTPAISPPRPRPPRSSLTQPALAVRAASAWMTPQDRTPIRSVPPPQPDLTFPAACQPSCRDDDRHDPGPSPRRGRRSCAGFVYALANANGNDPVGPGPDRGHGESRRNLPGRHPLTGPTRSTWRAFDDGGGAPLPRRPPERRGTTAPTPRLPCHPDPNPKGVIRGSSLMWTRGLHRDLRRLRMQGKDVLPPRPGDKLGRPPRPRRPREGRAEHGEVELGRPPPGEHPHHPGTGEKARACR